MKYTFAQMRDIIAERDASAKELRPLVMQIESKSPNERVALYVEAIKQAPDRISANFIANCFKKAGGNMKDVHAALVICLPAVAA